MKFIGKKIIGIALACSMTLPCVEDALAFKPGSIKDSRIYAGMSFDLPDFRGIIGKSSLVPPQSFNAIKESPDDTVLPPSFSLIDHNMLTAVKDQGGWGTCWAHSSATCAENSISKYEPSVDLSELHTAYYVWSGGDQFEFQESEEVGNVLNAGGTSLMTANLWAQWIGPVNEDVLPYQNKDEELFAELKYRSDYHLENAYLWGYDQTGENRDDVNNVIKSFISNGKTVSASFMSEGTYTNYSTYASCSDKPRSEANHSITIVGWDDNYSASNFTEKYRPKNNGAWLAQNSWGDHWGLNGFFWISYEDSSLCDFASFELAGKDNFDKNYQHDSFGPGINMSTSEQGKPSYIANVFTAQSDEYLEAVSVYAVAPNTEYEIVIYKNLTDPSDPVSGNAVSHTSGKFDLTGYFTVELDEAALLEKGEDFAVTMSLYCEDTEYVVPIETCAAFVDRDTGEVVEAGGYVGYSQIKEYTSPGQSFGSECGTEWFDVTVEDFVYSDEDKEVYLDSLSEYVNPGKMEYYRETAKNSDLQIALGNVTIKAFTTKTESVDFSHSFENVPLNEKLVLSSKNGETVCYTVNGGTYKEYTEPITVDEKITVSAKTSGEIVTKTFKPAKAEFNVIKYSPDYYSVNFMRINESNYEISVPPTVNSLKFLPVAQGDVYMNGILVPSYERTQSFDINYGENVFEFTLKQENRLDNTVTVKAIKAPVEIDTVNETLIITQWDAVVYDFNGNRLHNGDSLSSLAGTVLSTYRNNGDKIMDVDVPERALLENPDDPEFQGFISLFYEDGSYNEVLAPIPNKIANDLYYSLNGADYLPAKLRCIDDGTRITSGMALCQAFRVKPGETVTFKVAANKYFFESIPVTYEIPDAPEAPQMPAYSISGNKITFTDEEGLEIGIRKAYTDITLNDLYEEASKAGEDLDSYIVKLKLEIAGTSKITDEQLVDAVNFKRSLFSWNTGDVSWDAGVISTEIDFTGYGAKVDIAARYGPEGDALASHPVIRTISVSDRVSLGDFSGDGRTDANDASEVLTVYAKVQIHAPLNLTDTERRVSDVNFDGKIDAADASLILSYYAYVQTGGKESPDLYFLNQ